MLLCAGHEQGAGHAAQGYARVTGKPGIVLVTSGPGVPAPAPAIALQRELT
jgi:acetolactate synthase-1/2/3 large subunit